MSQDEFRYKKLDDHPEYFYIVTNDYCVKTCITDQKVLHDFFDLSEDGTLIIRKKYMWDGATCALDTHNFMRGSCVHDVLCQMLREKMIPKDSSEFKKYWRLATKELLKICKEDGMWWPRRMWVKLGVNLNGRVNPS